MTGANGFIGSHVVAKLLEDGFSVRAVVRDPTDESKVGHLLALPGSERLQCVGGSLLEAGGYDAAFDSVQAIVHTAAVVEVIDSSDAENRIVRPAVEGTKNVLAAARKANVRRLVMTSSVAAIQSPLGLPDGHRYSEKDWNGWSTVETDAYGYAKTQQERCLWDWDALEPALWGDASPPSFDAVVICPSVTLGPALCKAHTKVSEKREAHCGEAHCGEARRSALRRSALRRSALRRILPPPLASLPELVTCTYPLADFLCFTPPCGASFTPPCSRRPGLDSAGAGAPLRQQHERIQHELRRRA